METNNQMEKTSSEIVAEGEKLTDAAKAYGIRGTWTNAVGGFLVEDSKIPQPIGKFKVSHGCYYSWVWNPFEDSGDALRLAMKLVYEGKLRIQMTSNSIDLFENWDGMWVPHTYTMDNDCSDAVFRTAVTNVAAEIGKRLSA